MFAEDLAELNQDAPKEDRWKLYTVLQVPRSATTAEIEKSYRRLSMIYHTDRLTQKLRRSNPNMSAEDLQRNMAAARLTMSLLNQAKTVLTDPLRRAAYDRHGDEGVAQLESLDVVVRDSASAADILTMLDMLKTTRRQRQADVELGVQGSAHMLVDASDLVDVVVARLVTGEYYAPRDAALHGHGVEAAWVARDARARRCHKDDGGVIASCDARRTPARHALRALRGRRSSRAPHNPARRLLPSRFATLCTLPRSGR